MMNQIMTNLHEHKTLTPRQAGLEWVKAHPEVYEAWLKGVVTVDGKPGAPAFKAFLKTIQ